MKDHSLHRDPRRENLDEVPGDRLTLAILIGRKVQLVRLLEQLLEFGDLLLLVAGDDIQSFEIVLNVDAEAGPCLPLI